MECQGGVRQACTLAAGFGIGPVHGRGAPSELLVWLGFSPHAQQSRGVKAASLEGRRSGLGCRGRMGADGLLSENPWVAQSAPSKH